MGRVEIPLVGGPVDGRSIDVDVDEDGHPPAALGQTDLWVTWGSELLDADLSGRYELEAVAGFGPPWLYRWYPER
jgi:hypothetical protein